MRARSNLYTTAGTTSDTMSHEQIQALPGGTNQPVEKGAAAGARRVAGFGIERLGPCP